jgi:hypothetical protein
MPAPVVIILTIRHNIVIRIFAGKQPVTFHQFIRQPPGGCAFFNRRNQSGLNLLLARILLIPSADDFINYPGGVPSAANKISKGDTEYEYSG